MHAVWLHCYTYLLFGGGGGGGVNDNAMKIIIELETTWTACMSNNIPQNFNLSISTYWLISACMSRAALNMLFFWIPVNEPLLSESQKCFSASSSRLK